MIPTFCLELFVSFHFASGSVYGRWSDQPERCWNSAADLPERLLGERAANREFGIQWPEHHPEDHVARPQDTPS